jgi:sugar phosphate isomerase/epimerase
VYNSRMNRRTFVESTIAAGVLASFPSSASAATHQIAKVGVQLYTVRDLMKSDFAGTIGKVASVGYKEVEFAGYFDHSPAEVRSILEKNGLAAPSSHVSYEIVEKQWPKTIEAAHAVGQSFIVCPFIEKTKRNSADAWKSTVDLFNKAGQASKKAGIQFAYHNHWWEFAPDANLGGKLPYNYLLESTDANLVKMEMDLGWASVAGQDPVVYFKRYPGRFPLVHVKDFKSLPHLKPDQLATFDADQLINDDMTAPGSGVIDWKRIFASSDAAGIQHYFLEHDSPKDPWATLTDGYKYLSALRF